MPNSAETPACMVHHATVHHAFDSMAQRLYTFDLLRGVPMIPDDSKTVVNSDQEKRSADSQSDISESQLRNENAQAVMQQLINLGYMDAGLDI